MCESGRNIRALGTTALAILCLVAPVYLSFYALFPSNAFGFLLQFGYWPSLGNPDPKSVGLPNYSNTLVSAGIPLVVHITAAGFCYSLTRQFDGWKRFVVPILFFVACQTLAFSLFFFDFGGTVEWFMD